MSDAAIHFFNHSIIHHRGHRAHRDNHPCAVIAESDRDFERDSFLLLDFPRMLRIRGMTKTSVRFVVSVA